MHQLIKSTKLDKSSKWQLVLESTKDSDSEMFEKVRNDVLKCAPYLILIEGINSYSDKKCIVGIFCNS